MPKRVQILTPKHFNLNSPKETGATFKENSFLKAKFFSKKTKMICLADDSGLEIDSLNKLPGIYSARWGGKKSNFNLAIKKVYKELNKKNKFKGKIGIFEINKNKISHILNFYVAENNSFKKIF